MPTDDKQSAAPPPALEREKFHKCICNVCSCPATVRSIMTVCDICWSRCLGNPPRLTA